MLFATMLRFVVMANASTVAHRLWLTLFVPALVLAAGAAGFSMAAWVHDSSVRPDTYVEEPGQVWVNSGFGSVKSLPRSEAEERIQMLGWQRATRRDVELDSLHRQQWIGGDAAAAVLIAVAYAMPALALWFGRMWWRWLSAR